jgi:hypothetical protein
MANSGFSDQENSCLKKCYNKYFDTQLLIDREHEHFTVGNPYAWMLKTLR